MIQTLVLANLVHRPHSQISMRTLSEFVSQACWNRGVWSSPHTWCHPLVEVGIGAWFKKYLYCWKTASQQYVVGRRRFCCLQTQMRGFGSIVWISTQNWVRLHSFQLCSSACCSVMQLQCTSQWTCSSGTSKAFSTQLQCFDIIVRTDISIHFGEM